MVLDQPTKLRAAAVGCLVLMIIFSVLASKIQTPYLHGFLVGGAVISACLMAGLTAHSYGPGPAYN
jgi:predicted Kef-type K+ transport protein